MTPYYQDDSVTIYHGDCLDVLPALSYNLVVTSPPYNLRGAKGTSFGHLANGYGTCGDALDHAEYVKQQQELLCLVWDRLSDDGAIFYNHKPRPSLADGLKLPFELIPDRIPIRQIITWDRGAGHIHVRTMFTPSYEWILLLAKRSFRLSGIAPRDVWRVPFETNNPHPAPFPESVAVRCINPTAAQVILDPYMGSGTTLRAAKNLNRKAIGIEIEEKYCEIAAKRMAQEVLAL